MPDTITEYLARETRSFAELPVNEVDSLIFCTLSYINYETGIVGTLPVDSKISLWRALCGTSRSKLLGDSWLNDTEGEAFLANVLSSPRFINVQIAFYVNEYVEDLEKQFSAVTFILPDHTTYIAFRGTDNTLAGWKEDFNLCFRTIIPSQRSAQRYLSGVASSCEGPIIVGGHSKGGNLAEYAVLTLSDSIYERIAAVYDHDGPSFLEDPSPRIAALSYKRALHKTVPESSVFGMLLERRRSYAVVESTAVAFMQHAPLTWIVEGDSFLRVHGLSNGATLFDRSLNDVCLSYTPEQRAVIIDTVFDLFKTTNAHTWEEFNRDQLRNVGTLLKESAKVDPAARTLIAEALRSIAGVWSRGAFSHMRKQLPLTIPQPGNSHKRNQTFSTERGPHTQLKSELLNELNDETKADCSSHPIAGSSQSKA